MGLNKVELIGRLTKDPEGREFGERIVANFTLAVKRNFKDKNGEYGVDFIPVECWGASEVCFKYLSKGSETCIVGRLQVRSYDDKDGNRRYITNVVAEEVILLGSKNEAPKQEYNPFLDEFDDDGPI